MADGQPNDETKKVGPGNTSVDTRFKPGESGNPKGRPKGSGSLMKLLAAELRSKVKIQEGGKSKVVSKQRAMVKQFVGKALKGDDKVFGKLIPLMLTLGAEELTQMGQGLTDEQKIILERNARRLLDVIAHKERSGD